MGAMTGDDPNNPNWNGTGMTQADYYKALQGAGQNEQASATGAGTAAVTNSNNDPNNTTANPVPAGFASKDDYFKALAAGGQNASASASKAGDAAANTAFLTDPNDTTGAAYQPPPPPPLAGPGPGEIYDAAHSGDFNSPGAVETIYGQHGNDPFAAPSNSQTLFNEGMAGNDPYFSYAETQANKAINDAASARGGWNSGAAMSAIGNSTANLRGQQAMALYGLAPQADSAERQRLAQGFDFASQNDTAHANRIGAGMALNDDWQKQQQDRLSGGLDKSITLGADKADTTSAGYKYALDIYNTDGLARIEAELQKAGINPTGDAVKDFLTLASLGVKAGAAA